MTAQARSPDPDTDNLVLPVDHCEDVITHPMHDDREVN